MLKCSSASPALQVLQMVDAKTRKLLENTNNTDEILQVLNHRDVRFSDRAVCSNDEHSVAGTLIPVAADLDP